MKTNMLSEHPSFLEKDFRDDLEALASASPEMVVAIRNWIASLSEWADTEDDRKWIPLARETGKTIDELQTLFRPIRWISLVCQNDRLALSDVLDELHESGLVGDKDLRNMLAGLLNALERLVRLAYDVVAPSLPLLGIRRIRTRCILVSEYDKEFDVGEDAPETYRPSVDALHPKVILELEFRDKEHKNIGIALSESDLEVVTKWLTLARVQLAALTQAVPNGMLPGQKAEEQP